MIKNINGKRVEIYDTIEDLPIVRYNKLNRYLLIDSGIGSDAADIDNHIERIMRYAKKDHESAIKEAQNLRQNLYMISNEINPSHMSFATLVKSIDNKEYPDKLSDSDVQEILNSLSNAKHSLVSKLLEFVKKKIQQELMLYFPFLGDSSTTKEYYSRLLRHTKLKLDELIDGVDKSEEIDRLEELMLKDSKPLTFHGANSVEIKTNKEFNKVCISISKELGVDAKSMTVVEFFNAVEQLKELNK